jgi:hypothetical protein
VLSSLDYGQERGRKWQMYARLKQFSVAKFSLLGYDSWLCGEFFACSSWTIWLQDFLLLNL